MVLAGRCGRQRRQQTSRRGHGILGGCPPRLCVDNGEDGGTPHVFPRDSLAGFTRSVSPHGVKPHEFFDHTGWSRGAEWVFSHGG